MNEKVGRNDPCPCGSGKKFKQCCFLTKGGSGTKKKMTAKWIQSPKAAAVPVKMPDLMERVYGSAMHPEAPKEEEKQGE